MAALVAACTSSKARILGETALSLAHPLQSFQHPPQAFHDHDRNADHDLSSIGQPIQFTTGQFAGSTVRMRLDEVQKADVGRKYARIDRRPLDPPPVVRLRIFEVHHAGTAAEYETEREYGDIQVLGLLCTVDLFPVADAFAPSRVAPSRTAEPPSSSPSLSSVAGPIFTSSTIQIVEDHNGFDFPTNSYQAAGPSRWPNHTRRLADDIFPSQMDDTVIHRLGNFSILERSKNTRALAGTTFVQASLVEYQGNKAIMFAFSDLAVKIEGVFILRYRVFDLFSQYDNKVLIAAETYGGPFRVYSTKDFPGLQASTELTKNLARWGVRLNIREVERRRKK